MKKAITLFCLVMMFCPINSLALPETAVVQAPGNSLGFSFSPTGAPYGFYFNGTVVDVLESQGEWSSVRVLGDFEGYMRTEYLQPLSPILNKSEVPVGVIVGEKPVPLLEKADAQATVLGELLPGVKVTVMGTVDTYYHVLMGYHRGFVAQESVKRTQARVVPDGLAGIPEIGYLYFDPDLTEMPILTEFPNENTKQIEHPWLSIPTIQAYPMELLGQFEDWYQVRVELGAYTGFMKADFFDRVILLDDWFHVDEQVITKGHYTAGQDVQPGLYTYTLQDGEAGQVCVSEGGSYDKVIEATGPASYTLYVPVNAKVDFNGEGRLASASPTPTVFADGKLSYTGDGMFFVKSDLPPYSFATTGGSITFSIADATKVSEVITYNLLGEKVDRTVLETGRTYSYGIVSNIRHPTFIEVRNCTITIEFSHNG